MESGHLGPTKRQRHGVRCLGLSGLKKKTPEIIHISSFLHNGNCIRFTNMSGRNGITPGDFERPKMLTSAMM